MNVFEQVSSLPDVTSRGPGVSVQGAGPELGPGAGGSCTEGWGYGWMGNGNGNGHM